MRKRPITGQNSVILFNLVRQGKLTTVSLTTPRGIETNIACNKENYINKYNLSNNYNLWQ